MASKVILVTGGNKGIGLAIVETLLKQLPEAIVLLGSRDAGRNLSISMLVLRYFPRIVQGGFITGPTDFQYQNEKTCAANEEPFYIENFVKN